MDSGCGLKKSFLWIFLKRFLITLLNNSLFFSIGNIKNFHAVEKDKENMTKKDKESTENYVFSLFFLPLGKTHVYLVGIKTDEKEPFLFFKNSLVKVKFDELKDKNLPVILKDENTIEFNAKEIDIKFKRNLNYFYNSPKEERDFILKELENRIRYEENRENLALRKLLFYFSFFSFFFGYLINSQIDFFIKLYQSALTGIMIKIVFAILVLHLFIYAINIILLSLYGLSIKSYKELDFRDFKNFYSPKISYLRSLYFKWYKLTNLEVDNFISIVKNIEKYIKLFMIMLFLVLMVITFLKFKFPGFEEGKNFIIFFLPEKGIKL